MLQSRPVRVEMGAYREAAVGEVAHGRRFTAEVNVAELGVAEDDLAFLPKVGVIVPVGQGVAGLLFEVPELQAALVLAGGEFDAPLAGGVVEEELVGAGFPSSTDKSVND